MSTRAELVERYKLAYQEYRAEVALGVERQKLFLALSPAVAAFSAGKDKPAAVAALVLSGLASGVGILVVHRSHGRYRATRAVLLRLGAELGWDDIETTGGMREERGLLRLESYRVSTTVCWLLGTYALISFAAALVISWG